MSFIMSDVMEQYDNYLYALSRKSETAARMSDNYNYINITADPDDYEEYSHYEDLYSEYSANTFNADLSDVSYGYQYGDYGSEEILPEEASTLKQRRSSNKCREVNAFCVCDELEAENSEDVFAYFQQICKYNHTTNAPILVYDACYGF